MREILFRGFCPNESGDETIILDEEEIMGDWHYWNCFDGINRLNAGFMVTDTVGQWTGLTDKNGMRMFEHDKLKDNKGQVGTIFYSETAAAFLVNWKMKDGSFETDACFYGEVIGTIFDKEEV